jgi:hypothetical protein
MARFRDGKIAEMWMEADFLGLFQQYGMELRPKEETKKWPGTCGSLTRSYSGDWVQGTTLGELTFSGPFF